MELHLSMTWIPKQEEKRHSTFEGTFALSVLWSPKAGDHSRSPSFSVLKFQRSNNSCLLTPLPSKQEEYWVVIQG